MNSSEEKPLHSHVLCHSWKEKRGVQGWSWASRTGKLSCGWRAVGRMGPAQAAHVEAAPAEDAWMLCDVHAHLYVYRCSVHQGLLWERGAARAAPGRPGEGRLCCRTCCLGTKALRALSNPAAGASRGRLSLSLRAGLFLQQVGPVWLVLGGNLKGKDAVGNQVREKPSAALCSPSSGSVFGRQLLAGVRTCKHLCLDPIAWAGDLSLRPEMRV